MPKLINTIEVVNQKDYECCACEKLKTKEKILDFIANKKRNPNRNI
jgi:Txe/YoeB family toxin of Txe-Axe toxin-antitoxin module